MNVARAGNLEKGNEGLAEAIEKCNDYDNKAFLLTQLAKCATKEDMPVFSKYLKDSKLSDLVIMLLTSIPGNDTELAYLVKNTDLPHLALAKMVTARNIQGVEDVLLGWTNDSNAKTLKEVYNALATVGTSKSVDVLADAAKKVNYGPDPTFATNAYAKLLESLENDTKTVQKGAKALMKSETSAVRCAGLNLLLKSSGKDGVKNVLSALKDDDIEYRNTALACGLILRRTYLYRGDKQIRQTLRPRSGGRNALDWQQPRKGRRGSSVEIHGVERYNACVRSHVGSFQDWREHNAGRPAEIR